MPNGSEVLTKAQPLEWVISDQKEIAHPSLTKLFKMFADYLTQGKTPLCQAGIRLYLAELFCQVTLNPSSPKLSQLESAEHQCLVATINNFQAVRAVIIEEIRQTLAKPDETGD